MHTLAMPVLRPLPIPTRGRAWWMRLCIWLTSSRRWEVVEDWYFTLPDGTKIVILVGFISDGASIPRLLWWILSPVGLLLIQGLVHDFGYKYDYLILANGTRAYIGAGRWHWDRLFRDVGLQVNGFTIINPAAYLTLRLAGWAAWNKHRRSEVLPL